MEYTFNLKGEGFVYSHRSEVNASYKDLGAVCDAIRYVKAEDAVGILDRLIAMERAVPYRRHNKHMGSRHELGGAKGAYPEKAAREIRIALVNAIANAGSRGLEGESLFVVHASANKTHIERRYPSKGSLAWGRGMYGRSSVNHSDLEFAKIEIVLSEDDAEGLTHNMRYFIKKKQQVIAQVKKQEKKLVVKPKPVQKKAEKAAAPKIEAPKKPEQAGPEKSEKEAAEERIKNAAQQKQGEQDQKAKPQEQGEQDKMAKQSGEDDREW